MGRGGGGGGLYVSHAATLLRHQFPTTLGLQSTLLTKNKNNCNHMVCYTTTLASRWNEGWTALLTRQSAIINKNSTDSRCVHLHVKPLRRTARLSAPDVTQQTGTINHNMFAIAYITALCYGLRPEDYRLQQTQMRHHLLCCLEKAPWINFPRPGNVTKVLQRVTRASDI